MTVEAYLNMLGPNQGFFQAGVGGGICPPLALACPSLDMLRFLFYT